MRAWRAFPARLAFSETRACPYFLCFGLSPGSTEVSTMAGKRVGVLGSAVVGKTLAAGFARLGYPTKVGTRDPGKLASWAAGAGVEVGTFEEAARFGEVLVLAVKGLAAESALRLAGAGNLAGKPILGTTNPLAESPPEGGVLRFFTTLEDSLMERQQRAHPQARFVKAWSSVGNALMVDPRLPGGPPTMFVCGDDAGAKSEAAAILAEMGWETEDCGGAVAACTIEPLCILWCIPGFLAGDWAHAFKVLRPS
jgi:predicted dinucleotide-binding enzyme